MGLPYGYDMCLRLSHAGATMRLRHVSGVLQAAPDLHKDSRDFHGQARKRLTIMAPPLAPTTASIRGKATLWTSA